MTTFFFQEKEISTTEFHYDNLISTIMTLFLAGTQTTSSTLRHALNVLIKYPQKQGKTVNLLYNTFNTNTLWLGIRPLVGVKTDQSGNSFCFAVSRENAARDWHCYWKRPLSQDGGQEAPPFFTCCHPWSAAFSWQSPSQPPSLRTEWHILQGLYNPKGILNSKISCVLQNLLYIKSENNVESSNTNKIYVLNRTL